MAYNGRPQAELALQFINGNKKDVIEALKQEGESYGTMSAVALAVSVFEEMQGRDHKDEAEAFALYLRINYEFVH